MASKLLRTGAWTEKELILLKSLYPHQATRDVARRLKRSEANVRKRAQRKGLRKTKKYLRSLGRNV